MERPFSEVLNLALDAAYELHATRIRRLLEVAAKEAGLLEESATVTPDTARRVWVTDPKPETPERK